MYIIVTLVYFYSQIAGFHDNLAKIKEVYIKPRQHAIFNMIKHEKSFFLQKFSLRYIFIIYLLIYDYFHKCPYTCIFLSESIKILNITKVIDN